MLTFVDQVSFHLVSRLEVICENHAHVIKKPHPNLNDKKKKNFALQSGPNYPTNTTIVISWI